MRSILCAIVLVSVCDSGAGAGSIWSANKPIPTSNGGPPLPAVPTSYTMNLALSYGMYNTTWQYTEFHNEQGTAGEREERVSSDDIATPRPAELAAQTASLTVTSQTDSLQAKFGLGMDGEEQPWVAASKTFPFKDKYATLLTGKLRVAKAGALTFWSVANNGVDIFIDGELILSNDCCGREKNATLSVSAGLHDFKATHYETIGGQQMVIEMQPAGGARAYLSGTSFASPGLTLRAYDRRGKGTMRKTVTIYNYEAKMKFVLSDANNDGQITERDTCAATREDLDQDRGFKKHSDNSGSVRPPGGFFCRWRCKLTGPIRYEGKATIRGILAEKWSQTFTGGSDFGCKCNTPGKCNGMCWQTLKYEFYYAAASWQMPGNSATSRIPLRIVTYGLKKYDGSIKTNPRKAYTENWSTDNEVTNFVYWPNGLPATTFDPTANGFICTGTLSNKAVASGMTLAGDGSTRRYGVPTQEKALPPIPKSYSMTVEISSTFDNRSSTNVEYHDDGTQAEIEMRVTEKWDGDKELAALKDGSQPALGAPDFTAVSLDRVNYVRTNKTWPGLPGGPALNAGLAAKTLAAQPDVFADTYIARFEGPFVDSKGRAIQEAVTVELCATDAAVLYIGGSKLMDCIMKQRAKNAKVPSTTCGQFSRPIIRTRDSWRNCRCFTRTIKLDKTNAASTATAFRLHYFASHGDNCLTLKYCAGDSLACTSTSADRTRLSKLRGEGLPISSSASMKIAGYFWDRDEAYTTQAQKTIFDYKSNMKFQLTDTNADGRIGVGDTCRAKAEDVKQDQGYKSRGDGTGNLRPPGGYLCGPATCNLGGKTYYTGQRRVRGIWADVFTKVINNSTWKGTDSRDRNVPDLSSAPPAAVTWVNPAKISYYTPDGRERRGGKGIETPWPGLPTSIKTPSGIVKDPFLDYWACQFAGTLKVATAGEYLLFVPCTDGCKVYVDGKVVLGDKRYNVNSGFKSGKWRRRDKTAATAKVVMTAGSHQFRIDYYAHLGDQGLMAQWTKSVPTLSQSPGVQWSQKAGNKGAISGGNSVLYLDFSTDPNAVNDGQYQRDVDRIAAKSTEKPSAWPGLKSLKAGFHAQLSGTLIVPIAGNYYFGMSTTQAAVLVVNKQRVVAYDAGLAKNCDESRCSKGGKTHSKAVKLPKASVDMVVTFTDGGAKSALSVFWAGPPGSSIGAACGSNQFCNFDWGGSGTCEYCNNKGGGGCNRGADDERCRNCGLPAAGSASCLSMCSPARPAPAWGTARAKPQPICEMATIKSKNLVDGKLTAKYWKSSVKLGVNSAQGEVLGAANFYGDLKAKFWDRSLGYRRLAYYEYSFAVKNWRVTGAPISRSRRVPLRVRHFYQSTIKATQRTFYDFTNYEISNFVTFPRGIPSSVFNPMANGFVCQGSLSAAAIAMGYTLSGANQNAKVVDRLPSVSSTYKMSLEITQSWRNSTLYLTEYHSDGTQGEMEQTFGMTRDESLSDIPWTSSPSLTFTCPGVANARCVGMDYRERKTGVLINYKVDPYKGGPFPSSIDFDESENNGRFPGLPDGGGQCDGDACFRDKFAMRFGGKLRIAASGSWLFAVRSNDGGALYIDGKRVVNNDGNHRCQERNGTTTLSAGLHDFRLEFFENTGTGCLTASMVGPTQAKHPISAADFGSQMKVDIWDRASAARAQVRQTVFNYRAQMEFKLKDSNLDGLMDTKDSCEAIPQDLTQQREYRAHSDGLGNLRPPTGFFCRRDCSRKANATLYYNGQVRMRGLWADKYTQLLSSQAGGAGKWNNRDWGRYRLAYHEYYYLILVDGNYGLPNNRADSRIPLRIAHYYQVERKEGKENSEGQRNYYAWNIYDVLKWDALKKLPNNLFDPSAQGYKCSGSLSAAAKKLGMTLTPPADDAASTWDWGSMMWGVLIGMAAGAAGMMRVDRGGLGQRRIGFGSSEEEGTKLTAMGDDSDVES